LLCFTPFNSTHCPPPHCLDFFFFCPGLLRSLTLALLLPTSVNTSSPFCFNPLLPYFDFLSVLVFDSLSPCGFSGRSASVLFPFWAVCCLVLLFFFFSVIGTFFLLFFQASVEPIFVNPNQGAFRVGMVSLYFDPSRVFFFLFFSTQPFLCPRFVVLSGPRKWSFPSSLLLRPPSPVRATRVPKTHL